MALLAFHTLLVMEGMPIVFADFRVAGSARIRTNRRRAGNLHVLGIRRNPMLGLLGCFGWSAKENDGSKNDSGKDSGMKPHWNDPQC